MSRRFTYVTTLSFGDDGEPGYAEVEVEASFTVDWGQPESGRYGPPENYDPGSGDAVEDVRIEKIDGKPAPWNWTYWTDAQVVDLIETALEKHHAEMLSEAAEDLVAEEDDYRERMWEDARLDR